MEDFNFGEMVLKVGSRLILGLLLFLGFDTSLQSKDFELEKIIRINPNENTLEISNSTLKEIFFSLKINQKFPLSFHDIDREIQAVSKLNKINYLKAACLFVHRNTFSSKPISSENWQHQMELFLNSIGGGLCDDKASVLAYVLKRKGFLVRIINLNGHVVTVARENAKWKLLDPELGVYFCNQNKELLTVQEIIADSSSILSGTTSCDTLINPFFRFSNIQIKKYLNFLDTIDNSDDTAWQMPDYTFDPAFCLPSKSKITFQFDKQYRLVRVCVELSRLSKGNLKIPFVFNDLSGNFSYRNIRQNKLLNSKQLSQNRVLSIIVDETFEASKLCFLVNRKLKLFDKINHVRIKSSGGILKVKMAVTEEDGTNSLHAYFFNDDVYLRHRAYINEFMLSDKRIQFTEKDLKSEYADFLDADWFLTTVEKHNKMKIFQAQFQRWKKYFSEKNMQMNRIVCKENSYLLYCFFVSFKGDDIHFFESVLNQI